MAELPDWTPLNGIHPPIPEGATAGRLVALVATERAIAGGWAADAAIDLVRQWSRAGNRVVLVDGGLARPTLHTAAGVPNREGLSDATLHGASIARVSRSLDGGGFFLITAGAPVADPHTVVRSPRWYRLSSGFGDAGVTLALYVRDGDPGTAAFMGSVSDIIVLGEEDDQPPTAVRDIEPLVRAVTGPGPGWRAGQHPDATTVAPTGQGPEAAGGWASEATDSVDAALDFTDPSTSRQANPDDGRPIPTAAPAAPVRSGGAGRMIVFVVLAMVAAAILGWFVSTGIG